MDDIGMAGKAFIMLSTNGDLPRTQCDSVSAWCAEECSPVSNHKNIMKSAASRLLKNLSTIIGSGLTGAGVSAENGIPTFRRLSGTHAIFSGGALDRIAG